MGYYRPDGLEVYESEDGGLTIVETKQGRTSTRSIPAIEAVTISEASQTVRPAVSREAVWLWITKGIKNKKLKAYSIEGRYLIPIRELRKWAAKHGYQWAPPAPTVR